MSDTAPSHSAPPSISSAAERYGILAAYRHALDLEAHNLAKWPTLLAQQMYNRLRFEAAPVQRTLTDPGVVEQDGHRPGSWIKLLTRSVEPGLLRTILLPRTDLASCGFGADGATVLAVATDGTVIMWDAASGRELTSWGHRSEVTVIRKSMSSRRLVVGHQDGALTHWDTAANSPAALLRGHTRPILDCALSRDERIIASLASDALCLWDARTGVLLFSLPSSFEDHYKCCDLSPDGSEVIVGGGFGSLLGIESMTEATFYRWETATGRGGRVTQFRHDLDGDVVGCRYTPDGARIVWSREGWGAGLFVSDARSFATMAEADAAATGCMMSPDGQTFVMGGGLRDITTCDKRIPLVGVSCAFSPTGTELLVANADGTLTVWDTHTATEHATFGNHASTVLACDIAPDGRTALSALADGVLHLWDFVELRAARRPVSHHIDAIHSCAYSADGTIIVSGSKRWLITWDAATGRERESEVIGEVAYQHREATPVGEGGAPVASCQFDRAHTKLLTAEAGAAKVRFGPRFRSGVRFGMDAPDGVAFAALCPDNRTVVTTGGATLTIWLRLFPRKRMDVARPPLSSRAVKRLTVLVRRGREAISRRARMSELVRSLLDVGFVLSESMRTLRVALALAFLMPLGVLVRLWCARVARWCVHLPVRERWLGACTVSSDGRMVAAGSASGSVYLWHTRSRKRLAVLRLPPTNSRTSRRQLESDQAPATSLLTELLQAELLQAERAQAGTQCAFSPDGTTLASAHEDGTVLLWDVATRRLRNILRCHAGAVHGCAVTFDSQHIVTAGEDRTVRVWDLATGEQRCLIPFSSAVRAIATHPSQLRAVCGDSSGRIHQLAIEHVDRGQPLTAATFAGQAGREARTAR